MRLKLIPGILLAMMILSFIPVTTLATELQPLTLSLDSPESQFVNVSATSDSRISAEFLLQGLAEDAKTKRIISGWSFLGTGVLCILGASNLKYAVSSELYYGLDIIGEGFFIIGVLDLQNLSMPEKYYFNAQQFSDPNERETAAASYLLTLSSKAKFSRLIGAIASAGLSIMYFSEYDSIYRETSYQSNYDQSMGILLATQAVYSFLVKSPAEQAWETYETKRGSLGNVRTAFQLGVNPKNRGLCVGYKLVL